MNNSIEDLLYDFIVENHIATTDEINLVTDISGWSEGTMNDIIYARTGNRDYEQCTLDDYCYITPELDRYYGLNQEEDEDDEDDDEENED